MSKLCASAVLAFVFAIGAAASAHAESIDIDDDSYGAIAYSPSTGKIGYSYNQCCRHHAEESALEACPVSDARIVCWVNEGFCAIALGDDKTTWGAGWSYGDGASNTEAIDYALEKAKARTTGVRLELVFSSDGQYIYSK